ncbi:hypothetical protein PAECIP111893_00422 [Paenibacillus plantiphilus]|uniref:Phenylalanyl-tRNA synthetase subunit beta n=1 Tax=Paenibacillus plantiphilus TaxID=2905650 RepID=A0ABM9BRR2_9BACL|nr:hypothetical protein [Paenibacillus plantiphilus]CAH1193275.1 hypothetical protein PAECIP111893_00422 [Paenibacillus plantiphilus]
MKKWIIALSILVVAGYFGYQYAYQYVTDRVMDEVVEQMIDSDEVDKLLADPEVQQLMADSLSAEDVQDAVEKSGIGGDTQAPDTPNTPSGKKLVVKNKDEAIKLILDKFSIGELKDLATNAKGMSKEEQEELLSRFTDEELESLKIIGLMEVEKRKN